MTKAEQQHLSRVAALGCVLCRRLGLGETPATIHHIRAGQGMSQRASHFETIGLRAFEARYGCTERELLAEVRELLGVAA